MLKDQRREKTGENERKRITGGKMEKWGEKNENEDTMEKNIKKNNWRNKSPEYKVRKRKEGSR